MQKSFVPLLVSAYFQRRMKWLRLHITRITAVLLVGSGFGLFLVQPASSHQKSDALVHCLEHMAKLPETSDVKRELDILQQSSADFHQLVEKTTRLIHHNPRVFDGPLVKLAVSSNLYQILFGELEAGIDVNGLLPLPMLDSLRSAQHVHANILHTSGLKSGFRNVIRQMSKRVMSTVIPLRMLRVAFMHPMSSGIAIGAP